MDMKSLSALRFNLGSDLSPYDQDRSSSRPRRDLAKASSRDSDETNSQANRERDSSSSSYSSPSSSSSSPQYSPPTPPVHGLLPPPLLPLASFPDPPPLLPLLSSFVPGRFGQPGTNAFLSYPQSTNGNSFMPFHHPASVLLRHHQAALAYSYALMNVQQQQLLRQEKQLNKDRAVIFRPHEVMERHLPQQHRTVNSSAERAYYLQSSKVVPYERNDTRFNRKKSVQETAFLMDQLPVDLRKVISPLEDDVARYDNHHHHHHQQQQQQQQVLVLSTPKKNPTSGKKLIGIRFLFPPFADHVTLYERAKIWVARHEFKYFVDWSADDLLKVDLELRPIQPITRQQYKVHMNRSEFCRNVKLKFCLQTDSPWARDFCEKLQKSPAEGGFTGLCQAKIAAADLWRSYSENYRSHQARQPNGVSLKGTPSAKTTSSKKRPATAEESPSKKCAKIGALTSSNKLASKLSYPDAERLLEYTKLRNSYCYYYYRQSNSNNNNVIKYQTERDYLSDNERQPANNERGSNSSPGRCQAQRVDQSERFKISASETNDNEVNDDVDDDIGAGKFPEKTAKDQVIRKPASIWTPFGKASKRRSSDHDCKNDRFVGDKSFDELKFDASRFADVTIDKIATRSDGFSSLQQRQQADPLFQSGLLASGTPFSGRILEEFGKRISDLKARDFLMFQKLTEPKEGSDVNNNTSLVFRSDSKPCGPAKKVRGGPTKTFQPIYEPESSRNRVIPSETANQIDEKSPKTGQNFDFYRQVSLDKNRSGRFRVEPIEARPDESQKMRSNESSKTTNLQSPQNDVLWTSAQKVSGDSESCEDDESDVDVVDLEDDRAGSKDN